MSRRSRRTCLRTDSELCAVGVDSRFAAAGFAFDDQEITVAVPASFDAGAQQLTMTAAEEAGFPSGVRLLEEPAGCFLLLAGTARAWA